MNLISSKELTEKHAISYQTLNFYTTLGLLKIQKRVGNRRYYDEDDTVARFGQIAQLKEEGYPLRIIVKQLNKEMVQQPK